ncbi:octopamine receptor 1-like [Physella acuta]|uniref:octopamine receptor 1-like n=1 Tax=Physella acuta TaxID=109671 RepID=UPI0027DCBA93|nr:octopamine receptor 1-like [Physella acuta]
MNTTACSLTFAEYKQHNGIATSTFVLVPLAVVCSVITAFTIVVNLMLIIALVRSRRQETRQAPGKHGITQMLMTSMAVSDFIFGVFLMPLGVSEIISNGHWKYGQNLCYVRISFINILCAVSIFHVNCLALDKLLAVYKPMWYRMRTVRTGYVMVSVSWLLPVVLLFYTLPAMLNLLGPLNTSVYSLVLFFFVLAFYVPCMLAYVLYAAVLLKVIKYNRNNFKPKLAVKSSSFGTNSINIEEISKICTSNVISDSVSNISTNEVNSTIRQCDEINLRTNQSLTEVQGKRSGKAIYTIGSLVICFTICWLPFWIGPPFLTEDQLPFWFSVLGYWVGYCNSALNPVLCCFNRSVRQAVKSFVQSVIQAVNSFIQSKARSK